MHPLPFVLFGVPHQTALALAFIVPVALAVATRGRPSAQRLVRFGFAGVLIASWIAWYLISGYRGWLTLDNLLPFNLCDWAMFVLVFALLRPGQRSYELAYFWALGGTLQGLVTPGVPYDFPDPQFLAFCVLHAGIIAGVLYMTLALGMRPVPASLPRVIGWTLVYAIVAGLVDWGLGTDYAFLRAKPANASLYDYLSPWPVYIPEVIGIGLVSALVYYAPFFFLDLNRAASRKARNRAPRLRA
jgi:hypothetical integral membrane protein (TIGR02206 family)